ncbi:MAG TPA: glycosyltransferase [Blastocatellia bacterium]|nr:glycosyltransferase [Blastocatellia bacterium]
MLYASYVLIALLIAQGAFSLIEGLQFRAFVRRALREAAGDFTPKATIIAPCKGLDCDLEANVRALFNLDYPDYDIIFAIASADDPSRPLLDQVIADHPERPAEVVVAGLSDERSEKVNNLLAALKHVGLLTEALIFVDLDARVTPAWLRALVSPLDQTRVGAATGYRWYFARQGGFWSSMLSAWNGSVATTLGDHGRNFAWGGSTGIMRETFDRIGVEDLWKGAVSDDYSLTRAVQRAGLRVTFQPRCLVASPERASLASLLEFTTRQVTITRVYRPAVWWTGFASHLLFCAGFFGGFAIAMSRAFRGDSATGLLAMLGVIYILGSIKGWLRIVSAAEVLSGIAGELKGLWWMFCLLWPLVSVLFLCNFVGSAVTRRIVWRGVSYEMRSSSETRVVR